MSNLTPPVEERRDAIKTHLGNAKRLKWTNGLTRILIVASIVIGFIYACYAAHYARYDERIAAFVNVFLWGSCLIFIGVNVILLILGSLVRWIAKGFKSDD